MFTLKPHHETYFRPDIKGAPLWHAFILLALPPTKYEAQIIELWLEKGANAELLFWLETERRYARDENDGIVSIDSVKDNRDGSGRVSVRSVSRRMVSIGRKWPQPPFTLRQAIAFSNSSRKHHILDLIDAQIRERCSLAETSAEACTGLERFPDSTEVCQKTQSTNECDTRTENSQSENTAIGISNEVQHSQVDVAGKLQKRGTNLVWLSICFVFASTFGLLLARYLL
ncbi:hypothetical protein N431DRAFT_179760 [Stipitochalara longipes BDJ]|nr:hypothetical protein N431DRAFT_179760 [Stipitochalara longipes BDJ]